MSNGGFDWAIPLVMVGAPVALDLVEELTPTPQPTPTVALEFAEPPDEEEESPPPSSAARADIYNRISLRGEGDAAAHLSDDDLIICSWNIKWWGKKEAARYRLDWIADFAEECDILAVQEVSDPHHRAVFAGLIGELDSRDKTFRYRISPPTGYTGDTRPDHNDYLERYAFLWNDERVRLRSSPWFIAEPPINNPTFRQVPWVASFEVRDANGFDFHVATAHTVYNKKLHLVRRAEITALRDWVIGASSRPEKNAIAIGDFNANPKGQPAHFSELLPSATTDLRVLMYEPLAAGESAIRTTPTTMATSSNPTYHTLPVYDHVLVSRATDTALPAEQATFESGYVGVWDFDNHADWDTEDCNRSCRIAAVSDHRPIWAAFVFGAEDED